VYLLAQATEALGPANQLAMDKSSCCGHAYDLHTWSQKFESDKSLCYNLYSLPNSRNTNE